MAKKITIKKKKYKALISNMLKQATAISAANIQIGKLTNNAVNVFCDLSRTRQEHAILKNAYDHAKVALVAARIENQQLVAEVQRLKLHNLNLSNELTACQASLIKVPVEQTNVDKVGEIKTADSAMNSDVTVKAIAELTKIADDAWRDFPVTNDADLTHLPLKCVFAEKGPSVPTHPNDVPKYTVGTSEIKPDYSAGPGDDISFKLNP